MIAIRKVDCERSMNKGDKRSSGDREELLRVLIAFAQTIGILLAGVFLFIVLSGFMTGSDLRNREDLIVFVSGIVVIVALVLVAVIWVWSRALS